MSVSAALGLVLACAKGEVGGDGDIANLDAGSSVDAQSPLREAGSGGGDAGSRDSSTGIGCTDKIVINELLSDGTEFIELYNPNDCAITLTGWTVRYRSREDRPGDDLHAFKSGDEIAAGEFLLLDDVSGLGNAGGQVALVDGDGKTVDAVGYGPASGEFVEGSPAPLPSADESIGRKSDGVDTDDNAADFKKLSSPTPGAPN